MLEKYLPPLASEHGAKIDQVIEYVHWLMLVLFVGWTLYFIYVLFRFRAGRNKQASYEGTKTKISTYAEIGVIAVEAFLLLGFSIPFWSKVVTAFPEPKDSTEVRVIAEQFAWNVHYPGADGKFGKTSAELMDVQTNPVGLDRNDPDGADDIVTINQLHLPVGKPALIHLTTKDVIHNFSLPIMRVKQDVIPGMSIPTWFTPTKEGKSEIACAQLCGLGHYRMKGFLTVHTPEDYQKWHDEKTAELLEVGDEEDDFWG